MNAINSMNRVGRLLVAALLSFVMVGCNSDAALYGDQTPPVDPNLPVASRLIISTDVTVVHSDGSDSATIRVLALDSANASVAGVLVDFSTTAGVMTASSVVTDANGEAVVSFSAGSDPTNQTATITASSGSAVPASVPVDIAGSTVDITADRTNLVIGGLDSATITVTAANSAGTGVYNTPVSVSIDGTASTGAGSLSLPSGTTSTQGEFVVTLNGTSPGTVRVTATALNVTTYYDFVVEYVAGSLMITTPVTGATAAINVAAPVAISVPSGITSITLVSSVGVWSGTTSAVKTLAVSGPVTVNETLTSTVVGAASISVSDSSNPSVTDSVLLYFVDQTVDANSVIDMQAAPTTIPPSLGSTESNSVLTATVTNQAGGKIANARVTFTLTNTTGSGEYVYPPVAYTDAFGVATATLVAGSQSTSATGLTVTASLDQTLTTVPVTSSVNIIVGGTPGSISIGMSTTVASINNDTGYSLPVSVQVTDSGGNPAANTIVNLSLWPESYALGYWACKPTPGVWRDTILANEDLDKDTVWDLTPVNEDISGDAKLTPANATAGGIPATVTTDANGIATFNITYLKDNAGFVYDALTATTLVQGTETLATRRFWLPAAESDVTGCRLGESPFNTAWPTLTAVSDISTVATGGSSTITATLSNYGIPNVGASVTAVLISEGTDDGVTAPTLSASPQTTDGSGQVTFTYTAGGKAGDDWIKVTYATTVGVVIADYVLMTAE